MDQSSDERFSDYPQGNDVADSRDDLLSEIRLRIAEVLDLNPDVVQPGVALIRIGAQSFDFMHLAFRLEKAYGIRLPRSITIPGDHTVEDYVAAVTASMGKQSAQSGTSPDSMLENGRIRDDGRYD